MQENNTQKNPSDKKRYVVPYFLTNCQCKIINDEVEQPLHNRLGITNERAEELEEKAHAIAERKEGYNIAGLMCEMSTECKHPNELAFIAFHIGHCPGFLHNDMRMKIFRLMNGRSL